MAMTRMNRTLTWTVAGAAAVAGALTVYSALTGDHHAHGSLPAAHKGSGGTPSAAASAIPTYTMPSDWTEPTRWAALPRGKRTRHGREVGFPHTTNGAVGMLAAASATSAEGDHTTADEHLAIFDTYMVSADQTKANRAKVKVGAEREYAQLESSMGLPTSEPLPPGAYVRTSLVGFKVIEASRSTVSAYLLTDVARKAGETAKEQSTYTVGVLAVRWQDGDWRISSTASAAAAQATGDGPAVAAPGDAAFNSAGWVAIRQAS
jgi:hypothetical protein